MIIRRSVDGRPDCAGVDYSGKFSAPTTSDTYSPGETVDIAFHGGSAMGLTHDSSYPFTLILRNYSNSTLANSIANDTAHFDHDWLVQDDCGNTKVTHKYVIPEDFQPSPNPTYMLQAYSNNKADESLVATSEPFTIRPNADKPSLIRTSRVSDIENHPVLSTSQIGLSLFRRFDDSGHSQSKDIVVSNVSSTGSSSGPTTSTYVAIVVPILAVAAIVGGILRWGKWTKRQDAKDAAAKEAAASRRAAGPEPGKLPATTPYEKPELDATMAVRSELPGDRDPAEMSHDGHVRLQADRQEPAELSHDDSVRSPLLTDPSGPAELRGSDSPRKNPHEPAVFEMDAA